MVENCSVQQLFGVFKNIDMLRLDENVSRVKSGAFKKIYQYLIGFS